MSSLPYARQSISDADLEAVRRALTAEYLTQGPGVAEFEARLAERVGARYAVAVNSGTAALHAAYAALDVGPGRAVCTSAITFAATTNAALYLGGAARFADVDPDTALLDPTTIPDDPAIHVVTPVHLTGQVVEMEPLAALARRRGWRIVEDACHALGASYRTADGEWHPVGACHHSDLCCFSFHPAKHITTGEGGAVTTNDPELYRRLLRFRTHGITRDPAQLQRDDGPWYYEQHELGYNYRLTDLQCALGLSQLPRLSAFVERRRALAAQYDVAFRELSGELRPLAVPAASRGSYHLYVVRVAAEVRRAVFERLRGEGIGVNVHYLPVYQHPYYREHGFWEFSLPEAERYYAEAITLPLFPDMKDGDVTRVVSAMASALNDVHAGSGR